MRMTIGRGFVVGLLVAAGCSSTNNAGPGTGGSAGTATGGSATGGSATGGSATGGAATGGTTASGGAGGTTGVAGTSGGGTGGGAGAGGSGPAANIPPTLAVPVGATLKTHLHGTGAQIYTCTASTGAGGAGGAGGTAGGAGTTYSWVLKAPDAMLLDQNGTQVGTHGAGPNWTSTVDGSVVNGSKVYQENSPLSDAIPWLLLRATSNTGTGVFSDVTYVQRLNTTGGKAPATGCDSTTVGMDTRVSYTADYYFYTGGGPTNWLDAPAGIPSAIAVPAGNVLTLHDHAIGAQVYTCTASGGADAGADAGAVTYSWVLKAPDAVLYDATFAQVGTHGAGPNWTSTVDGSVVNGMKVAQANAPISGAIPWLLLKAMSTTGTGVFTKVTYVQRINTNGGVAPATGCSATTVGMDTRVSYSADYEFFTAAADGGTTN